jgi:succinoglycan biosynthesis protein ExoA
MSCVHHEILVRCDAHSIYPPDFVRRVAESLHARGVASLVVPMDATSSTRFGRASAWVTDTRLGNGGAAHRGGHRSGEVDHGHHAAIRLDWFRRVGGYDAAFSHNEDAEFDLRLRQAGGQIWLDADIRIAYVVRPSLVALARQYWRYGQGRAKTLAKHRARPLIRQMVPVANVAIVLGGLAMAPLDAHFLIAPAAYATLIGGVSLVAAGRERSIPHLWAGPALASMHLPWGAGFIFGLLRQLRTA